MTSETTRTLRSRIVTHECGGSVLIGGSGDQRHLYCDRCGAYTYDTTGSLPTGTNAAANRAAWDDGDEASPAAKS